MNAPTPLRRFLGIHGHRRRKAREAAGCAIAKDDVLLKEQLPAWFMQVRALPNRTVAAYLQALLLVGCRREELLRLRWDDINWQWKGLRLADKVDAAVSVVFQ